VTNDFRHSTFNRQIDALLKHKNDQAKENRDAIFNAIRELGEASINEIVDYLHPKVKEANAKLKEDIYVMYHHSQKERKKNSNRKIHKRTVQRWVRQLIREGLVEDKNKRYSISEKGQDIKYWADNFGGVLLSRLMRHHFPTVYTFKLNLQKLIQIFGTYIVYAFVEAARPIEDSKNANNSSTSMSLVERDKLAESWVRNVFDTWNMYGFFLAAIESHPGDKEVNEFVSKHFREGRFFDNNGNPIRIPSAHDLRTQRWLFEVSEDSSYDKTGKPNYELDRETIEKIEQVLENEDHYDALLDVKVDFLREPKITALVRGKRRGQGRMKM
jgi:hypothetical protein